MGSSPREVVERLNAELNAHEVSTGLYAERARLVTAGGRELDLPGLARLLTDTLAAFPDLRISVERWIVEGDLVVTEEVMEGTHLGPFAGLAPTNRKVRLPLLHVTRVVDGQIVERVAYHDTAGILRSLS